jgi:MFS family permease
LLAVRKDLLMLSIALILYGVSWGTRAVSEWTFLTDLVEPEIKTISISYLSSVFGLGSTIGSILAGILNLVLPYGGIFLICSALNFGALPIIKAMKKT